MNILKIKKWLCVLVVLCFSGWAVADTYVYDPLNRLTSVTYSNGGSQTYDYDAAGNLTSLVSTPPTPSNFTLTVNKAGAGTGAVAGSGISCGTTCSASFTSGTSVTLTATPATGSSFTGWSGDCTGTGSCTVSMSASKSVTATFALSVTAPVCTLSANPATITAGSSSTLTATCTPPASSYIWSGGTCAGTSGATCTVTPTSTTTYTVTGANAGGTNQAASATVTVNACTYALGAESASIVATGGSGSVSVASSCAWTAMSNASWISITSGASGIGNGSVFYTVAANTGAAARTGTLTIAGKTYTVVQSGPASTSAPQCTLSANPSALNTGETATLVANCNPAATSYTWTGGTCTGANGVSCAVTPSTTTTYTVKGSNTMGTGAISTAAVYVCNTAPAAGAAGVVIAGNAGNEQLNGGLGNDSMDGAGGVDTVIYHCNRANFTIQATATGWTAQSIAEGLDTLTNVERLQFADKTLALDINGNAGKAYRIYQAAFNRTPDNGGLKYWIGVMDGGASLSAVSQGFVNSAEFQAVYGTNPTNDQLVTRLYSNVLHRAPDQGGYDYWMGLLNAGLIDKIALLASFSESPENQAGVLSAITNGIDLLN